jgi:thiol-disulfide isomerase/thioredoxin
MRVSWRRRVAALAVLLLAFPLRAHAGELAYDKPSFEQALTQRRAMVVAFVAEWCNTCTVQQPVLSQQPAEPRFRHLTVFVADFGKEHELKRRLRVAQQSTLVVFKDGREVARSTGQTHK